MLLVAPHVILLQSRRHCRIAKESKQHSSNTRYKRPIMEKMEVEKIDPETGAVMFENDPSIKEKIAEAVALTKSESIDAAVEKLLALERANRLAAAAPETTAVCVAIVQLFREVRNWQAVGEYVVLLSKRRAQLKSVVTRTVQEAMQYLDLIEEEKEHLSLLETLRDVTAGKIYVELEGARLTRRLAGIKEAKGDIEGAADIMQELQVETFGGMERAEKFDFILEQMRLCLEKNDFVRAAIISKKIIPRQLNKDEFDKEKMQFYSLMIRIHARNKEFLSICRAYLERYGTVTCQAEPKLWSRELKLACLFLILSPKDSMQSDLLHRIRGFKNMEALDTYVELLKLFATDELIGWPHFVERFGSELTNVLKLATAEVKTENINWESALKERITEHNLRVVAQYYSRIRLGRLAELLDLSEDDTERKLAAMVSDKKAIWAKIDRPAKIVSFAKPKDADATLNAWASNVSNLLDIVERTCHLVHRETMVYNLEDRPVPEAEA